MQLFSISDAAEFYRVTRQSIHAAIVKNRIKAHKTHKNHWIICEEDLNEYYNNLYMRENRCKDGEITAKQASDLIRVPLHRIYYLMRKGFIEYEKRKGEIFIQRKSLI